TGEKVIDVQRRLFDGDFTRADANRIVHHRRTLHRRTTAFTCRAGCKEIQLGPRNRHIGGSQAGPAAITFCEERLDHRSYFGKSKALPSIFGSSPTSW